MRFQGSKHHRLQVGSSSRCGSRGVRPIAAYRQRAGGKGRQSGDFSAPERWHEPTGEAGLRFVCEPAGDGYVHPVTEAEVRDRLAELPAEFVEPLEVVQFSRMTRKRGLFPCYGMQWGPTIYLYPIEASLEETYASQPKPAQMIEARMFGGEWYQDGPLWKLRWTPETIRDFYLNNVLIHELGHVLDTRNTNFDQREQYAIWFATEYGYRASRGRTGA